MPHQELGDYWYCGCADLDQECRDRLAYWPVRTSDPPQKIANDRFNGWIACVHETLYCIKVVLVPGQQLAQVTTTLPLGIAVGSVLLAHGGSCLSNARANLRAETGTRLARVRLRSDESVAQQGA